MSESPTPSPAPAPTTKEKWLLLVQSRKFWAALIGLGLITARGLDPSFPLEEEALTNIVYLLVAYIIGTGIEDSGFLQS